MRCLPPPRAARLAGGARMRRCVAVAAARMPPPLSVYAPVEGMRRMLNTRSVASKTYRSYRHDREVGGA